MTVLLILLPLALLLSLAGLAAFFWSLKSGQYDDLDGAAQRILIDEDALPPRRPDGPPPAPADLRPKD